MPKFTPVAPQFVRILSGDVCTDYYARVWGTERVEGLALAVVEAIGAAKYSSVSQREIADLLADYPFNVVPGELTAMLDALVTMGALEMERTVGARQFSFATKES